MTPSWIQAIDARAAAALASGDLLPVQTEQTEVEDAGMRFILRWVSTLAAKDAASAPAAVPGGPRNADFNPFLNPDPELTVGPIGTQHVAILNKFPLCERHLVLARREFDEQRKPLQHNDFLALAELMREAGGLALYNGGRDAGASQRHLHVQWMPSAPGNASLGLYLPRLPAAAAEHEVAEHPNLPMRHRFVRAHFGTGTNASVAAASMETAWRKGCQELGLQPGTDGLMPPYNLLASDGWLLLLPRRTESFEGISFSAIHFGGTLYTRHTDQIEAIRRVGPIRAMAAVCM